LSADGESIALVAPDRSIIDSVDFTAQAADVSSGRLTDGGTMAARKSADFLSLLPAPLTPELTRMLCGLARSHALKIN
jgi:hypothetical protein